MPLPGGLWWLLCCRRGFTLLHRDYGDGELSGDGDEDEDEETFELRTPSPAGGGRGPLDVTLTQPVRSGPASDRLQSWEETRSLIPEKGPPEEDPDVVVKGWLYREPRGGGARPWLPPRRAWFVLTRDSLDQFSSSGKGARRLGSLVLTSLCSVTGPERRPKETGLWSVTVSGRKHSIRLCSPRQAEAERWGVALREVIASKAPLETPTQLLLRDIQESCGDPEAVALIYRRNPILRHTSGALYAPLLPLPYGVSAPGPGYAPLREEAVRLFLALQALEGARRPGPLMQGVLQTCRDLPALRDELFLQLAKQTSGPAGPPGPPATQDPAALRYWQLLTCMSCTFRPGGAVRGHLLGHLERTEQALPDTELAEYARFIRKALGRTRGRELVPSLAEISALSRRQELLCTVHCPGAGACPVAIDSHTTAGEVARELVGRLGLARSRNAFALYEQRGAQERALAGSTLVADVLTRFENLAAEEAGLDDSTDSGWRLCLRLHGPLHPEGLSPDGHELPFLFEQAHALLLRGRPPPPEDTLRALAALRLQSLHRDFSPREPLPPLDRLLPPPAPPREDPPRPVPRPPPSAALLAGAIWSPGLAKRRAERTRRGGGAGSTAGSVAREGGGGAGTAAAVLGGWKRLRGMGRAEAMAAYLALAAQCPGFGAARYDVLELSTEPGGGTPQKLCLGLGAKAMSLSRPGETEPIHCVSYGHVAACQLMGPHTLALRVGESQLLLQSPQVEEIMQLVNAYLPSPSPERPCRSPSPPCQDLPDTSPPSQHPGLDEPQGQSGCLGQLQD
ncbi:pleckstrin homology domain-containing family H member 3 isoform X1 [Prionailurus viverrinus]|uniref:Pleckstrin homology, MyTH4 and FERM domain containing H3 n=2 Tax=Felinae TaxID=338152 RepID=A0ABI7X5P1_FELCA|nr:pleckstrin homology domain-containing family H member 3 isoform X1 [Felis catus]XP_030152538.1 pleckstrin homology domain-containing family H member 3 isoform X1 [Lynx canadensis]XP_042821338.1 pleckstrin homology domain-containing family H member 3 isoform X1 [Panthera tigris]XP_043440480.1 pleckstrin homology domain-containing family H member 3 isoform X1 [Prionailurus bengalensis]XP_046949483.1 pleckstrin homology domain-containing family H member 3 [Lynx rufus]XP_047701518.1 pleckstrin 